MVGAVMYRFRTKLLICAALTIGFSLATAQAPKPQGLKKVRTQAVPPGVMRGKLLFARDCSFCHGRDAAGGETGPDLTRSHLVARDVRGDQIRAVVLNGRQEKGMPPFPKLLPAQLTDLIAFIRDQAAKANARPGERRGVDVSDLQTGDAEAGKAYFNGPGKCSSCHSPTGDLAGVATRHVGLELEMRMLYPEGARYKVTVTTASNETLSGTLAYQDEFTIGMIDASGWYRSWPANQVQYKIDAPANAHAEQFEKYTDDDIHNLMAYLQTLQ